MALGSHFTRIPPPTPVLYSEVTDPFQGYIYGFSRDIYNLLYSFLCVILLYSFLCGAGFGLLMLLHCWTRSVPSFAPPGGVHRAGAGLLLLLPCWTRTVFSWRRHSPHTYPSPPPLPLPPLPFPPSTRQNRHNHTSIPRVSLCRVFFSGGAGSGIPHPPNTKPCVILFTNLSKVPQAEEGTRRLLSLARETRPQPPRSSVRPSQPPAASSRCGSLPSGKSCRWDGMPSRCCRRGVWAIGQPLLPPSPPPLPPH